MQSIFRKIYIRPACKFIFQIPHALSVPNQHKFYHRVLLSTVTKDSILFYYEKERVFYPKAGERSFYHLEKVMLKSKALTFLRI
ncbi:hypothetical protein EMIT0180MI3_60058 [Priestia megaterium]